MSDPLQVRVGGPLRVPHAGEGPEGVPEAPETQTVSVQHLDARVLCLLCLRVSPSLPSISPLLPLTVYPCSTVDDCPPNQKVRTRRLLGRLSVSALSTRTGGRKQRANYAALEGRIP